MVVRHINSKMPTLESLKLPPVLQTLAMLKRGLVRGWALPARASQPRMAAMLDWRNEKASDPILTVEDPMEFEHSHKKCIVDPREVGLDTRSFDEALRRAMREATDVIMIGEIRDRETMQHAMAYAETGHLCVSTLHANNANQVMQRIT